MELRLQSFSETTGRTMSWVAGAGTPRQYELRAGHERFATMIWPSAQDSLAYAETAAGGWLLTCKHGQVRALASARRATLGRFEFGWDGGIFYLPNGETFHWGYNAALGRSEWVENGLIMRATFDMRPDGPGGQVSLASGAARMSALPLLIAVDRYLMHSLVNKYLSERQSSGIITYAPRQPARAQYPAAV